MITIEEFYKSNKCNQSFDEKIIQKNIQMLNPFTKNIVKVIILTISQDYTSI